ncbi:MAG: hypothetical protein M9891_04445 [Austwickia sp.]|nr:hypothetical protein [Actinomycetota bacterium]MCB1252008.1 hypothetical protein [Austwickia sp.]MCO5308533.1 hypothetical protein [Austwickia sp.]
MTIQQAMLFAAPSALAGLAILWWTTHVMRRRGTARVRDGICLELAMPPAWALDLAQAQFAVADWTPVDGDGALNRQHRLPGRPGVSVEAVALPEGGCEVHLWMSSWTLRGGIVRYAGVARRQMHALAQVLRAADLSYDKPVRPAQHAADVLDLLMTRQSARDASAA